MHVFLYSPKNQDHIGDRVYHRGFRTDGGTNTTQCVRTVHWAIDRQHQRQSPGTGGNRLGGGLPPRPYTHDHQILTFKVDRLYGSGQYTEGTTAFYYHRYWLTPIGLQRPTGVAQQKGNWGNSGWLEPCSAIPIKRGNRREVYPECTISEQNAQIEGGNFGPKFL